MINISKGANEMADIIDYRIEGDDMQLVEVELDPGEGIFLATLTGPGTVYLQNLPFSRLADRILAAATYRRQDETTGIGGIGGGILGGLFGGDRGD
jgi:uncharacterized protein (AIM24 family)